MMVLMMIMVLMDNHGADYKMVLIIMTVMV